MVAALKKRLKGLLGRFTWEPGDLEVVKPEPPEPKQKGTKGKQGKVEKARKPAKYRLTKLPDGRWVLCNRKGTFSDGDRKFWNVPSSVTGFDFYVEVQAVGLKAAKEAVERGEGERVPVQRGEP